MIENPNAIQQGGSQYGGMAAPQTPALSASNGYLGVSNSHTGHNMAGGGVGSYRGHGAQSKLTYVAHYTAGSDTVLGLEFKPSPFYTLEQQLGETKICEGKGVATA